MTMYADHCRMRCLFEQRFPINSIQFNNCYLHLKNESQNVITFKSLDQYYLTFKLSDFEPLRKFVWTEFDSFKISNLCIVLDRLEFDPCLCV